MIAVKPQPEIYKDYSTKKDRLKTCIILPITPSFTSIIDLQVS